MSPGGTGEAWAVGASLAKNELAEATTQSSRIAGTLGTNDRTSYRKAQAVYRTWSISLSKEEAGPPECSRGPALLHVGIPA
jgi:hypothetical protein